MRCRLFGGLSAPFELQCLPLYLLAVYIFYPHPGLLAFAVAMAFLTIGAELMTRRLANAAYEAVLVRTAIADFNAQNQQMLKAMGFAGATRFTLVRNLRDTARRSLTALAGVVEGDSERDALGIKGTQPQGSEFEIVNIDHFEAAVMSVRQVAQQQKR